MVMAVLMSPCTAHMSVQAPFWGRLDIGGSSKVQLCCCAAARAMCSFMRLLEDEALRGPYASRISVLRSTEATDIQRDADGQLSVTLRNTRLDSSMAFRPNLVLGCDGINSVVRSTLKAWSAEQQGSGAAGSGSGSGRDKFGMVLAPSLSTNLRFKVLQLPANPAMVDGTVLTNPSFCLLAGQKAPLIGEQRQLCRCGGAACSCGPDCV